MKPESMLQSFRWQYLLGFAICAGMLAYAIHVQLDLGIEPCPLCQFQRFAFIAMGIFFLCGGLHNPSSGGRRGYALLVLLAACVGIGIAAYHLWVQHLPPDPLAGCTPGWNYMVENFPVSKTLKMVFSGHGDCAEVNWTFLGLAMPFWTLVSYVVIAAAAIWAGFRKR